MLFLYTKQNMGYNKIKEEEFRIHPCMQVFFMIWKPLPIGIDNFRKMREGKYYYIDKTLFIKELLDRKGEVNLFTRPRRFGKTLNMSMLRYFLDIEQKDIPKLFAGTKIMDTGERYLDHMGKYPVIMLTLKSMKQATYDSAFLLPERRNIQRVQDA